MKRRFQQEDVDRLWYSVPGVEFLEREEFAEIYPKFYKALDDIRYGVKLDESDNFKDFLDDMGMSERFFPWEDFRDWYDAI